MTKFPARGYGGFPRTKASISCSMKTVADRYGYAAYHDKQ